MSGRILPVTLDYSDRDFDSLKLRLQGLLRSVFPDWTDFNAANFGNILVELFSFVGDVLNFYQDGQAAESFLPTLTQRISMIRLGQLIGFSLTGASAASATETFSLSVANSSYSLPIPVGTRLRTSDSQNPTRFQTLIAGVIAAGDTTVDIEVEQSERKYETFTSTDEPNQEFVLTHTPFLDGSMDECEWLGATLLYGISAVDGDYTRVDSLLGCISTDRVFLSLADQFDRCHVRFGNGSIGAIPQGEIQIGYKIGGGSAGNAEAGKIAELDDPLFFSDGSTASVTVSNATAAVGGAERMTLAEARAQAPASLRLLTRSVSREDFETAAKGVRGVARALMVTSNEYAGIDENSGRLYVVAQGSKLASGRFAPAAPSTTMLSEVYDYIMENKPPTITFSLVTYAAVFKTVNISTRIALAKGSVSATVAAQIRADLADFFASQLSTGLDNPNVDFGANLMDAEGTYVGELVWSDLFNVIRDVPGVRKEDEGTQGLLLNGVRQSVTLLPIEFPKLGSIVITDMDTGLAL